MADTTAASKVEEHPEAPAAAAEDGTPVRTVSLFRENTRVATAVAAGGTTPITHGATLSVWGLQQRTRS